MNAETVQTFEQKPLAGLVEVSALTGAPDTARPRVLVIEDDLPLAKLLCVWLGTQNFVVAMAPDGEAAIAAIEDGDFDLLLMDLNLPKMDGLALLAYLRASEHAHLPVLVLSGRSRTEDTVSTLNQGADDYLIKPFSLHELLARAQALLRRQGRGLPAIQRTQALTINREEFSAQRDGTRIDLTPREFAILEFMMQNRGKPVSRATLMQEVWKTPLDPGTNIVDVYMKYLRDKIDLNGKSKLIRTIRGVGYILNCA
jgi:DNA-binding response OmpR family regulator